MVTLSQPAAVPGRRELKISIISVCVVSSKKRELTKLPERNERCEVGETGIFLAKDGPILVKKSQN